MMLKQDEIAYNIFEKRETIQNLLKINLGGDDRTDWFLGEKFLTESMKKETYAKRRFSEMCLATPDSRMFKDDLQKAEKLMLRTGRFANMPAYKTQVEAACRVVKAFNEGKKFISITAPFQVGKTGVFLVVAEIMLKKWENEGKIGGRIIIISMNGKTDLEKQIKDRIDQYAYTASVRDYSRDVIASRLNKGKDFAEEIDEYIEQATEKSPILIISDESHWGTEVGGLFSRKILEKMELNAAVSMLTVSATPFEQLFSSKKYLWEEILLNLALGYVGPSTICGRKMPCDQNYIEEDVIIEECIPSNFKYHSGRSGSEIDKNKVRSLVEFFHQGKYFEQHNVSRWSCIEAADVAADYMTSLGLEVIRHYGPKHLNTSLTKKLPSIPTKSYCLVVVDVLQCSWTLPPEIRLALDASSFSLTKGKSNIAAITQALYGRMCGYGRHKSKIVSCVGMKEYIDNYKFDGSLPKHARVQKFQTKAKRAVSYITPNGGYEAEVWESKITSAKVIKVEVEQIDKLTKLYMTYKHGEKRKRKEGDQETKKILSEITGRLPKSFWYRKLDAFNADKKVQHWGSNNTDMGIFYDEQKQQVWGVYCYEDAEEGQHKTTNNSVYENSPFLPTKTNIAFEDVSNGDTISYDN
jgi:hypothetical protein